MKRHFTFFVLIMVIGLFGIQSACAITSYGVYTSGGGITSTSQYTTYGAVGQAIIGKVNDVNYNHTTEVGFLSQIFHGNTPPILTIDGFQLGEYSKVEIPVIVEDAEQDSITVYFYYNPSSSDSVKVKSGENTDIPWISFDDLGYVYKKSGIFLCMKPFDGEAYGDSVETELFTVTNLIGDFTYDLTINGGDVPTFVDLWNKKDINREIGPAQSTPPDYNGDPITTIQKDNKIDIYDLAVFGWMWNWSSINKKAKVNLAKFVPQTPSNDALYTVLNNGIIEIYAKDSPDYVWLIVEPFKEYHEQLLIKRGVFWDTVHTIEYQRQIDTLQEMVIAHLDNPSPSFASRHIATIETTNNPPDMTIYYAVKFEGFQEIQKGAINITTEGQHYNVPVKYELHQNFPNPFNPLTTIYYAISDGKESPVTLQIFDIRGTLVRTLVNGNQIPGIYNVEWDGTDDNGQTVSSGGYMYRLHVGETIMTKKMLFIK